MERNEILEPSYMKNFSCIGGECEDTCCAEWYISIDEKSYKKYKKIKHHKLKNKLEKNIVRNRKKPTENNVAKMKLENNACTFLTKDKWCEIHANLGEEYLCNTCKVYPKMINKINGVIEKVLTTSCPEAARKILLNKEKIEFNNRICNEEFYFYGINKDLSIDKEKLESYFWDLRIFSISLMQNRKYSVDERLIILGLFYNKVQESINNKNPEEIINLIKKYNEYIEKDILNSFIKDIPKKIDIQMNLSKALLEARVNEIISSKRYLKCLDSVIKGLGFDGEDIEYSKNKYIEGYEKYYKPFITEHEYVLENYIVNYIFKNCFPIDCIEPLESYSKLVIHYSLIKIHLIGMGVYNENLDMEMVIKLIQSIGKSFEHSKKYFETILEELRKQGKITLADMVVLIKN